MKPVLHKNVPAGCKTKDAAIRCTSDDKRMNNGVGKRTIVFGEIDITMNRKRA